MKRLLAAVFLLSAGPARALPCPVRALDARDNPVPLEDSHPTCAAAAAQTPRFERLRAAAGIPETELEYVVEVGAADGHENAYYWARKVGFNDAYFRKFADSSSLAPLASLAHEVGHAVQHRLGVLYPDMTGKSQAEKMAFYRRKEAHADAIAVELLLRAGYPPDAFVRGREQRFSCAAIAEKDDGDERATHPADRHRWVNSLIATPRVAADLAARHRMQLERVGKATPAELDAAFTGAALREGEPVAALTLAGPRVYKPAFQLGDFDERGRIMPGRLASSDLRLSPPAPGAGTVAQEANFFASIYADRVADYARDLMDWWYTRDSVSDLAVRACGASTGADIDGALGYGVTAWSRDAAIRAAQWLQDLLPGPAAPRASTQK